MKTTIREAVTGYQEHARSLGLSESYLETQMSYLTRFASGCDAAAKDFGNKAPLRVNSLNPNYISRFFQQLPNTRASHNRALTALKSFILFSERMKYIEQGSAQWLLGDRKAKTFVRRPKYYIPVSQFGPMIEAAGERHPVDRITLALAFYTLCRQGEVASLKLKDLDFDNRTIRIYRSKRKRWTVVAICPELADELSRWLSYYADETGYDGLPPRKMIEDHPDWYLAPKLETIRGRSPHGPYDASKTTYKLEPDKPPTRLEYIVKRMLDAFGAQTEDGKRVRHLGEGMHTIRRSGARAMIDYLAAAYGEDKALLMVSTMLDHDNVEMTLLYIGRNIERKRLNAFLEANSMYGDHGRISPAMSNVARLPLHGSRSNRERLSSVSAGAYPEGEVDAL